MRHLVILALWLTSTTLALALTPEQENRAQNLFHNIRCMVCQNQAIDESDAPLAQDLRSLVRERIEKGDSDDDILTMLTARYGEFVLLRPRFAPHTLILWLTPFFGLGLGGYLAWRVFRA